MGKYKSCIAWVACGETPALKAIPLKWLNNIELFEVFKSNWSQTYKYTNCDG